MPRQFLLTKKIRHRIRKVINGVEMFKCPICRKYKFNEEYYTHTRMKGKRWILNGHKMSRCIVCYEKLKKKHREWAKIHNKDYRHYLQYKEECKKVRSKLNLSYEHFHKIKNKLIILTKDQKIKLIERMINNLNKSIDSKVTRRFKTIDIKTLIGYDLNTNYSRFLSYIEAKLPEQLGLNLKNYGVNWYLDYEEPTIKLNKSNLQIEHFYYKNIIIKTIENLY